MLPTHLTTLTGTGIVRLMNRHRMTIAGLAAKMGVTKKRVRANGVSGYLFVCDWQEAITESATYNLKVYRP